MKVTLLVVVILTFLTGATAPAQAPSPTPAATLPIPRKPTPKGAIREPFGVANAEKLWCRAEAKA